MSPINYFNQLKIQKACQLLDFTDKKAKEIAFELAFNDPYYFQKYSPNTCTCHLKNIG